MSDNFCDGKPARERLIFAGLLRPRAREFASGGGDPTAQARREGPCLALDRIGKTEVAAEIAALRAWRERRDE